MTETTGWTSPPVGPWGCLTGRRARALCEDGKVRAAVATAEPDTFFSVPARVTVQGRTVSGFLMSDSDGVLQFLAYTYGKNGHLLKPTEEGADEH